jgi:protein-tyrosine phosphatase
LSEPLAEPLHVLHVCTGNICRSPMAERIMRHELVAVFGPAADVFDVRSAGTYGGHEGEPMNPPAARALNEIGIDGSGHRATWLRQPHVLWADLVLTGTAEHRAEVLTLEPAALRRTFALRELARLAAHIRPDELADGTPQMRLRALAERAGELRALHPASTRTVDDLGDPYGGPPDEFRRTAHAIQTGVRDILRPVRGQS